MEAEKLTKEQAHQRQEAEERVKAARARLTERTKELEEKTRETEQWRRHAEDQEKEVRRIQSDLDWLSRDGIEKVRDLEEARAKEKRLRQELAEAQEKFPNDLAEHRRIIDELNRNIADLQNKDAAAQRNQEQQKRAAARERELHQEALESERKKREAQLKEPELHKKKPMQDSVVLMKSGLN